MPHITQGDVVAQAKYHAVTFADSVSVDVPQSETEDNDPFYGRTSGTRIARTRASSESVFGRMPRWGRASAATTFFLVVIVMMHGSPSLTYHENASNQDSRHHASREFIIEAATKKQKEDNESADEDGDMRPHAWLVGINRTDIVEMAHQRQRDIRLAEKVLGGNTPGLRPNVHFCNADAPLPAYSITPRTFDLPQEWKTRCAELTQHPNGAATYKDRNWCWAWMKFEGCLWTHGHWSWWEAQERLSQQGKAPDPHNWPFTPLLNASLCERPVLGETRALPPDMLLQAREWVQKNIAVYVLNLPSETSRYQKMLAKLQLLGMNATRVFGVNLGNPGELEEVQKEGLMPTDFNVAEAQREAAKDMGGITGTIGVASAHFRALNAAYDGRKEKPLALIMEDDTELVDDFAIKLWRVLAEAPCDWLAISLKSRCPYGECVTSHLTRVRPDGNEPSERCHHGVNYGFYAMLYRANSLDVVRHALNRTVWRENRPHCFDIDVALASISEEVPYYAVPAAQQPGLLHEGHQGSSRYALNSAKLPSKQDGMMVK